MTNQKAIIPAEYLNQEKTRILGYASENIKEDKFMRSAMIAFNESDNLQECLKSQSGQQSVYNAMCKAASTGLSLNPLDGKAALVAYKGKCTYQVMKNGLIELAMDSGQILSIQSDIVKKNDEFFIEKTENGDTFKFRPSLDDRGDFRGVFAAVKMKNGETHVTYMSRNEVTEHRDKYSAMFRAKPDASPWKKSFDGMALKTVIKRLFRNLYICPEMNAAIAADDKFESMQEVEVTKVETIKEEKGVSSSEAAQKLSDKQNAGF